MLAELSAHGDGEEVRYLGSLDHVVWAAAVPQSGSGGRGNGCPVFHGLAGKSGEGEAGKPARRVGYGPMASRDAELPRKLHQVAASRHMDLYRAQYWALCSLCLPFIALPSSPVNMQSGMSFQYKYGILIVSSGWRESNALFSINNGLSTNGVT